MRRIKKKILNHFPQRNSLGTTLDQDLPKPNIMNDLVTDMPSQDDKTPDLIRKKGEIGDGITLGRDREITETSEAKEEILEVGLKKEESLAGLRDQGLEIISSIGEGILERGIMKGEIDILRESANYHLT